MAIGRGSWIGVAALCAFGGAALAAEGAPGGYDRRGLYLGLGGVYAIERFDAGSVSGSNALGIDTRVGYRAHRHLGAELNVQHVEGIDLDVGGQRVLKASATSVTANAKGYPFTGRVQPYGLVGLGGTVARAEDRLGLGVSSTTVSGLARLGGGIDLYATRHLVATAEVSYALPTGTLRDFAAVPVVVGAQYRF